MTRLGRRACLIRNCGFAPPRFVERSNRAVWQGGSSACRSWELFEQQDQAYRDQVLPPDVTARVSGEEGSVLGWDRYVGMSGARVHLGSHAAGGDEIR
jgi:hypothetical protein